MSDTVMDAKRTSGTPSSPRLASRHLPRWSPLAIAAGAIVIAVAIGAGAGLSSHIQWGLIALILFVAGSYAITARVEGRRQAKDRVATSLVWSSFILAVVPLYSLVQTTISKGVGILDGTFLTHSMNNVLTLGPGGGVYHAIIGTLEQVGIATVIAAPLGMLTAIYLVEYGRGRLAKFVTFFVDVMTGIPSIVAGLFILSVWFVVIGKAPASGFAGSLALALLMMPVVVRSTEEMLKLVPNELREASLALGIPKWRTIVKVVLPTAVGGISTGIMLAIARIAGERPDRPAGLRRGDDQHQPLRGSAVVAALLHLRAVQQRQPAQLRPCVGGRPGPHRVRDDPEPHRPGHLPLEGAQGRSLTRPHPEVSRPPAEEK